MARDSRGATTTASTYGSATIVELVASGRARTRAALGAATGLSRSTLAQRLDGLFVLGVLQETAEGQQSGGRPAKLLTVNPGFGVGIAVDVGERHATVALTDLDSQILMQRRIDTALSSGPETVLEAVHLAAAAMLDDAGRGAEDLTGIGIGLPAPVDSTHGSVVGFSVLHGWESFDIPGWFAQRSPAPVLVENDVNLLAVAEHREFWSGASSLLFVKAGTGIGSGILNGDALYRGAQGAAGDIGHIQMDGHGDPACRCGNIGCVEALAAGWALVRDLQAAGIHAQDTTEVVELVRRRDPVAMQHLRAAGRIIGQAVAQATSILNPAVVVVGGALAGAGDLLLTGIREVVYRRSLPLATRDLTIATSRLGEDAGVRGAAHLVVENWLRSADIERRLARTLPH